MKRKYKQENKTYNNYKQYYTKNNDKKEDIKLNFNEINHENTQFTKEFMASRKKVFKIEDLSIELYEDDDPIFEDEPKVEEVKIFNQIELKNRLNRFFIDVDLINYDLDFKAVLFTARSKEIFQKQEIRDIVEKSLKRTFLFNLLDFKIFENYLIINIKYNPMRSIASLLGTFIDNLIQDLREYSDYSNDRIFSRSSSLIDNQNEFQLETITEILKNLKNRQIDKIEPNLVTNIIFVTRRNRHIFKEDIKDSIEKEIVIFFESQKKFKIFSYEYQVISNYIYVQIKFDKDLKLNEFIWNLKRSLQNLIKLKYPEKLKGTALFSTSYCVSNKQFNDVEIQSYLDFHYVNYKWKKYHKIK